MCEGRSEDNECSKKSINRKHFRTSDTNSSGGSKAPRGDEQKNAASSRHQKKVKASNNSLSLLADLALASSPRTSDIRKAAAAPQTLLQNEQKPPANDGKQVSKKCTVPPKEIRTCLKEGCGRILTGKQKKRCEEHHMRCARKECSSFIQEHHFGLCYKHVGGTEKCRIITSTKKGKFCLKEGCGKPLIGQQKKRCKEHHWQCAKEGCTKNEQSNYGGFCKAHFSPNRKSLP
jgi:hypothetical protein